VYHSVWNRNEQAPARRCGRGLYWFDLTAASTAATTVAAAAASTATTVAASATTATAAVFLRTRFVDGQGAAIMLLAVDRGDRGRGLFVAGHFDKAKTLAATRVAVVDDLGAGDRAMLREQLFEV
jgi:hypothetical protein